MPIRSPAHTLVLPVALHAMPDALIQASLECAQENGQDRDWVPQNLTEAVYELVLAGDALVSVAAEGAAHFPLTVSFDLDLAFMEEADLPLHLGLERALLTGMMAALSPCDMGFEIISLHHPTTQHEHLTLEQAARTSARAHTALAP